MSFYRTLLAVVATVAIASPVFAEDTTNTTGTDTTTIQTTDATTTLGTEQAKVNVNTATAKDLMKVKGLNASKARVIVSYRKKHGDFKTVDDLAKVKGFKKMKPDTLKNITEQLTVE